jgi:uncharacterized repeat protein (TIGR02543 family)/LPXTG-motif cell wall-anchored protein
MMVPVKPRLRGGSNSPVLRLIGVFLLLISSLMAVSSATSLSPVQASGATVTTPPSSDFNLSVGTPVSLVFEAVDFNPPAVSCGVFDSTGPFAAWPLPVATGLTWIFDPATQKLTISGTPTTAQTPNPAGLYVGCTNDSNPPANAVSQAFSDNFVIVVTAPPTVVVPADGAQPVNGEFNLTYGVMLAVGPPPATAIFFEPKGFAVAPDATSCSVQGTLPQGLQTGWSVHTNIFYISLAPQELGTFSGISVRCTTGSQTADSATYTIVVSAPGFTVTFNSNGGTGTMQNQTASTATQLSSNGFTRQGYTFLGWDADQNASSPSYSPSDSYEFSANITLYAIWELIQYTVTFNSNGGTGTMQNQTASTATQLSSNGFTRQGYTFLGWDADQNASSPSYSPSDSYDFSANITLYAIWAQDTVNTNPPDDSSNTGGNTNTDAVVVPDTTPTTSEPAPVGVGESDLITEERQEQLTAPAGDAKMLIGGELVDVALTQAPSELRATAPAERTAAQVSELQTLATTMVAELQAVLGANTTLPISVRNTPTGAVIVGLARNPITGEPMDIPVEHVVLVSGGGLVLMASGVDSDQTAKIGLDGALEIPEGGHVSVIAGGLTPGADGEVVVMSTPQLISSFDVGTSGEVAEQAALPTDLPLGDHTVVVTVGDEAASLGFRLVPASTPTGGTGTGNTTTLPATGSDGMAGSWAILFAALGALALLVSTRRRIA